MTPEAKAKLKEMLFRDESYKQFPYIDTTGHLTIGIGRNLVTRGISTNEALYLLDDDIIYFVSKLSYLIPFFSSLSENRQIVCINLCFNLGVNGFLEFRKMLAAIEKGDFDEASREILNSKAAIQLPERYSRLAFMMKTGEI